MDPKVCDAGYYSTDGATECTICAAGRYCPTAGTDETTYLANVCPAGKLCPEGTDVDPTADANYDCPVGQYCLAGALASTDCPAGTYRDTPGADVDTDCTDTPAGFYTGAGADSFAETPCDKGYYCPLGSTGPQTTPCPEGTFRDETGAGVDTDCDECPAGSYCPLATINPEICPQGYYCEAGVSVAVQCPEGTYGAIVGATADTDCTDCSEGNYCP